MGLKLARQPCPREECDSSDGYFVYDDGDWCFSCGKGTAKRTAFKDCIVVNKTFRGVEDEVSQSLGFSSWASPDDTDTVLYRMYTYPGDVVKYRQVPTKKFWSTGTPPALGGAEMHNAGSSNSICVVEGEEDAAAFKAMCNLPVVWLTSAAIKTSERKEIFKYLSSFKKVIMAFESDDAGNSAKKVLGTMLAGKCFSAPLTKFKDASEYLQNNCEKEFYWAVVNAKVYTADFVWNSTEDWRSILFEENVDFFIPTPFDSLNYRINGLPLGHIVLITGMEGLGKTEILRAFEYEVLSKFPDYPISITHHEESKANTLKGLASYILDKNTKDDSSGVTKEDVLKEIESLSKSGNLNLLDIEDGLTVDEIMGRFKYLVDVCGVKYFFIDPINQFSPPDNEVNITKFLDNLAQRMAKFCVNNNVCCVWTAHVNDEGQTRDSRMISKAASIRIDIDRDHMSEDDSIKNTTKLKVPKNRPYANTGTAGDLLFDSNSFTLTQKETELPF